MPDECLVADSWYRKIAWSIVAGDQEGHEAHRIRSKLSLSHLMVAVNVHRALLRVVVAINRIFWGASMLLVLRNAGRAP